MIPTLEIIPSQTSASTDYVDIPETSMYAMVLTSYFVKINLLTIILFIFIALGSTDIQTNAIPSTTSSNDEPVPESSRYLIIK